MGDRAPGPVLVGEDVEDLLLQLVRGHVVPVLGCADEVVAHLLLLSAVSSVLGALRLQGHREKHGGWASAVCREGLVNSGT